MRQQIFRNTQPLEQSMLPASAADGVEPVHGRANDIEGVAPVHVVIDEQAAPLSPAAEPKLPWDFSSPSQKYADKKGLTGAEAAGAAATAEVEESTRLSTLRTRLSAKFGASGEQVNLDVTAMVVHFSTLLKNKSAHTAQTPSEMREGGFRNSVMSLWDSTNHLGDVSDETLAKVAAVRQSAHDQAKAVESKRLSGQDVAEDDPLLDGSSRSSMNTRARRQRFFSMLVLWAVPTACTVWYAAAIFFPVDAQAAAPALLWTPGATVWINGTVVSCCPKPALCSEGWAQFWLLVAARLSAFAMYPSMLLVFLSKCHAALRFLSRTFVAELLPLSHLHGTHTFHGILFASLALLHTVVHLVWPEDPGTNPNPNPNPRTLDPNLSPNSTLPPIRCGGGSAEKSTPCSAT